MEIERENNKIVDKIDEWGNRYEHRGLEDDKGIIVYPYNDMDNSDIYIDSDIDADIDIQRHLKAVTAWYELAFDNKNYNKY